MSAQPEELTPPSNPNSLFSRIRQEILSPSETTRFLFFTLLTAMILRLVLTTIYHGHPTDINNFKAWAIALTKTPFSQYYSSIWCDYPPGYLYVLWLCGEAYRLFDPSFTAFNSNVFTLIVKMPGIICDLLNTIFIFAIVRRLATLRAAMFAGVIYAFFPPALYESAIWGQMDSVILTIQLATIWLLFKGENAWAIFFTALGILVKPQGAILLPFVLAAVVLRRDWLALGVGFISSISLALAAAIPFHADMVTAIPWLFEVYTKQRDLYPFSSIQTFNIWSFTGLWQSDDRAIAGIAHKVWGSILFGSAYVFALVWYARRFLGTTDESEREAALIHTVTLILVAFFLLPTRMHERYLFSGIAFLCVSQAIQMRWRWPFYILSVTFMINLIYELKYPGFTAGFTQFLATGWYKPLAALNLGVFGYMIYLAIARPVLDVPQGKVSDSTIEAPPKLDEPITEDKGLLGAWTSLMKVPAPLVLLKNDWAWIGGISFFALFTRFWRLESPAEQMFDEVYHARTALEYLVGQNPFEWVHPPLAKLLIAIGVYVHGMDAWGWRVVPAIAGVLAVPFLYLLAKNILRSTHLAALATFIFTLDGVYLVQSRTAMTNIFAVTFQIMVMTFFWMYLQRRYHQLPEEDQANQEVWWKVPPSFWLILTGFSMGLAIATRWTTLWLYFCILGLLFLIHVFPRPMREGGFKLLGIHWKMPQFDFLFWIQGFVFLIGMPIVIYLGSYAPYMFQGHTLMEVINQQPAIWRYHANLRDPHPYYSAWYTWPLLYRPTWYFFHDNKDGTLSGVIALGNPAIWWASFPAALIAMWIGWRQRLLGVVLGAGMYFILYTPWIISPRILNYNHYLFESIPYACLAISFLLGQIWAKSGAKAGRWAVASYLLIAFGMFIFFFPLWTAYPITWDYYKMHIWFSKWV